MCRILLLIRLTVAENVCPQVVRVDTPWTYISASAL